MAGINTSMLSSISSLQNTLSTSTSKETNESSKSFSNVLTEAIQMAEQTNADSNAASLSILSGTTDDISSTLISTEKAELALNLTVAIRNKAVDAYKEIMNMQV